MNNLLIGGSGFIGSRLAQTLLVQGEEVTSLSRAAGDDAPGVTSIEIDLATQPCPVDLIQAADRVFILIGQNHVAFDANQEAQFIRKLAHDLHNSRAHVIYFSTVLVYGNTQEPASETSPCAPIGPYSTFKKQAETILADLIPAERLTILRLTNVYGDVGNRGIIGVLMNKINTPQPTITLNGDGLQQRDYLFIDDLVRAIILIANHPSASGIVNIATGTSHSLIEVVEAVSQVCGIPIRFNVNNTPTHEPTRSEIDNTRLREVYGFHHFTPFLDGLTVTRQRYKEVT